MDKRLMTGSMRFVFNFVSVGLFVGTQTVTSVVKWIYLHTCEITQITIFEHHAIDPIRCAKFVIFVPEQRFDLTFTYS